MTADGEEAYELLADHRLGRGGLEVKLDKGFDDGVYCVYVEFGEAAARIGCAAARRMAGDYCARLKGQLGRSPGFTLGATEDGSRSGDPRRRRDLELTFLCFPITADDGRFHNAAMKESFRLAFLRTGQAWDQEQAQAQSLRRRSREDDFRRRLDRLLDGEAYVGIDAAVKERLLEEVPGLAFPPRGIGP
jgi:hypothetical protein